MAKVSIPSKLANLTKRAEGWLPWLAISMVVTALLLHGTSASAMVFQSPASPVQPTMAPTDTPIPEPTRTPIPPITKPPEVAPTDTPVAQPTPQPPEPAPAVEEASPTPVTAVTPTVEAAVPGEETEAAATDAIPTQTPGMEGPPATEAAPPSATPPPALVSTPAPGGRSQSIVNWAKFWDTLAVWVAYPWLCCGIVLLLLVPAVMLYLEIMGRRRPQTTPERLPERVVPPRRRPPSRGGRSTGE